MTFFDAHNSGAGLGIQNCWCKFSLKICFGKFVGTGLKNLKGLKELSNCTHANPAPLLNYRNWIFEKDGTKNAQKDGKTDRQTLRLK